jgi:cobalt-zinc-cadmium efflux system protein
MSNHNEHHHSHIAPSNITKAFIIGIILNSVFVIIEAIAGLYTHSLSLLADAGHNLSDVAGLALALFASKLALKKQMKNIPLDIDNLPYSQLL